MKKSEIFRKKSLDTISSPESLTEYIRVANPGVWVTLLAIAFLMVALLVLSFIVTMSDEMPVSVVSDSGRVVCYVRESDFGKTGGKESITIDGKSYALGAADEKPVRLSSSNDDEAYIMHIMNIASDEAWVFKIPVEGSIPEGVYEGKITGAKIKPIKYLTN